MFIFCNPAETNNNDNNKIATYHKPGPCFGGDAVSGPNSNSTWELLVAGGADTAEYPDSLDWYPR